MITTAGYKNTFAYNKLIQYLVWEIVKPEQSLIMGGTWRIPVLIGLYDKNFIKDLKQDGEQNVSAVKILSTNQWGLHKAS